MHMLNGYRQYYKLIDEPRHVEYSFVLKHCDDIIILRTFRAELGRQPIVSRYRLFHIVQTTVAWHGHCALGMKQEFKKSRSPCV